MRSEETGREKSAENHYPTLPTDEIVELMVGLIGGDAPAVLFLWATNPMLLDALRVLEASGFKYVHHWIWDKEWAGPGYWGRDRHELLLIGTRGAAVAPLPGTQPETVYRERKGKHSVKPDFYAETIERLYPGVARLELFSRRARPGWDAWGFEADLPEGPVDLSSAEKAGEIAEQSGSLAEAEDETGQIPPPEMVEALNALDQSETLDGRQDAAAAIVLSVARRHSRKVEKAEPDAKLVETVAKGMQTETGRKALVAAVDAMIAAEEAPKAKRGRRKAVAA